MTKNIIFSCFVGAMIFLGWACFNHSENSATEPQFLNHDPTVTYVGKEVCKGCHADIYNTYIQTGMGKSWGIANKEKSSASFKTNSPVYDTIKDLYYHPNWNGDTLQITEFRLFGRDTIHKRIEKIKYIVGSGQHTNSHIYEVNGFLYQAPLTFYTQKQQWNLPPGFEHGNNSRFSRPIELECMTCHNALPDFNNQSQNNYRQVENGLSCERCHGPGSLHVAEKQKGNIVDIRKETDRTIVNPAKLSWQLQIDLCQRCHLQGNAILQPGKEFTDFRPGMPLHTIEDVYMPRYAGDDSKFIMASHAERLQKSKCFLKSNNLNTENGNGLKFTCITCHNPHISVKVTGKEVFNQACMKCHEQKRCTADAVSLKKENNNCVKCHMPSSSTTDIPHVSVHDHYIRKPANNKDITGIQKFLGITCVNNPNPTINSKIEGYLNYFEKFDGKQTICLDSAFNLLNQQEAKPALWIHFYYLKSDYDNIVKLGEKLNIGLDIDCWTSYRIAESYIKKHDFENASLWIDKSVKSKPLQLDFLFKKGFVRYNQGKTKEAKEIFEKIISLNPKYAEAYSSLGLIICAQGNGDLTLALQNYDKALALDPDLESALINSLDIFNATGDKKRFLAYLNRLYRIAPKNVKLQAMYATFIKK